jgi:hypothetical protein
MMNKFLKKNNRKGFANTLQIAIIAIAVILVLGFFLFEAYDGLKERMSIQSCKASITAHSIVSTGSAREIFTDIKCPTNEITIDDLKKTNEIIAEDMHRCWYIWNQGQGQYFKGDGTFCQICSIYQFGDKNKEVSGLINYLGTQPIKVKYTGDTYGMIYADYFMGTKTAKAKEMINKDFSDLSTTDKLNTSLRYATVFVYASGKDSIQKALEGGGRSTLGTVGMFGTISGGLAIGIGIFIASNPLGWIVGGVGLITGGAIAIMTSLHVEQPETLQQLVFRPYNVTELNALGCEYLPINQMSNAGKP